MNTPTATTDTPLRLAWPQVFCDQVGKLVPRDLEMLFRVFLNPLTPGETGMRSLKSVSFLGDAQDPEVGDGAQTVINNVGMR
ncbi:MAG TPA: hypothetical protein PKD12_21735 [Nitrospira sp.]|nr:hypothetical protein [Nitrospira sp.]